jgi:hypothetical protein
VALFGHIRSPFRPNFNTKTFVHKHHHVTSTFEEPIFFKKKLKQDSQNSFTIYTAQWNDKVVEIVKLYFLKGLSKIKQFYDL